MPSPCPALGEAVVAAAVVAVVAVVDADTSMSDVTAGRTTFPATAATAASLSAVVACPRATGCACEWRRKHEECECSNQGLEKVILASTVKGAWRLPDVRGTNHKDVATRSKLRTEHEASSDLIDTASKVDRRVARYRSE